MRALHHVGAAAPGLAAPEPATNETARGANAGRIGEQGEADSLDFTWTSRSAEALHVIEGERYADAFLARLQAQQAGPDELPTLVGFLSGPMLRGFCNRIEKALMGRVEGGTA